MTNKNALLWTAGSNNRKTGDIPTAWVGGYDDRAKSCAGCTHFNADKPHRSACYAWTGTAGLAGYSIDRAAEKNPKKYTVVDALRRRSWSARVARLTAIGDPTAASDAELETCFGAIEGAGLRPIGYTQRWFDTARQWLRGYLLASTATPAAASRAISQGWKVARTVSLETFVAAMEADGPHTLRQMNGTLTPSTLHLCPAQVAELQADTAPTTCNDCRMCDVDALKRAGLDGVVFAMHGPSKAGTPYRRAVKKARDERGNQ
jgi:hypothetical protein